MDEKTKQRLWARAKKEPPKPTSRHGMVCTSCGAVFTKPKTVIAERERRGWCTGCFRVWMKYRVETKDGSELWRDRNSLGARTPYDSRLGTDE